MINWVCSLTCYSGTNRQCSLLLHRHILCYTNGTSNIFCSRWLNQKFSKIVLLHSHLNIRDEIHSVLRYHRIISLCLSIIYNEWLVRKVSNCTYIFLSDTSTEIYIFYEENLLNILILVGTDKYPNNILSDKQPIKNHFEKCGTILWLHTLPLSLRFSWMVMAPDEHPGTQDTNLTNVLTIANKSFNVKLTAKELSWSYKKKQPFSDKEKKTWKCSK